MDQESNQMEQQPNQLCRNGCGFYSNAGTEGLCSVCYKDVIKKKQQPPTNMPASLATLTPAPGAMASLSIEESSPVKSSSAMSASSPGGSVTSSLASAAGAAAIGAAAATAAAAATTNNATHQSVPHETGSPTVVLPQQQTNKSCDSDVGACVGGVGGASVSSALSGVSVLPAAVGASPSPTASESSASCGGVGGDLAADGTPLKEKKKKNKCLSCKKKVGLTGFTCRCGGLFCSIHRYSDKHDCTYDYKTLGEEEIKKNNPLIVAAKVQKI